jgi:hypothetical protein
MNLTPPHDENMKAAATKRVRMSTAAALFLVVLGACGGGGGGGNASSTTTVTTLGGVPGFADHTACVASARAIEVAAAVNYAKTGSYGSVADLVNAGYLRSAPKASWALVVGPDGTVNDSTCP